MLRAIMGLLDKLGGAVSSGYGKVSDKVTETVSHAVETVEHKVHETAQHGLDKVAHTVDKVSRKLDKLSGAAREVGIHNANPELAQQAKELVKRASAGVKGKVEELAPWLANDPAAAPMPKMEKAMPKVAEAAKENIKASPRLNLAKVDQLVKAGKYEEAEAVLTELEKTSGGAKVDLLPVTSTDSRGGAYTPAGDGKARFDPEKNRATVSEVIERRRSQINQLKEMKTALKGEIPDPRNIAQMRKYFARYGEGRSADEVAKEYGRYLDNFYGTATGAGGEERVRRGVQNWPIDEAGRRRMNCTAHSDLTRQIFQGSKRFDLMYGARNNSGHEYAVLVDRQSGKKIKVDILEPGRIKVLKKSDDTGLTQGEGQGQFTVHEDQGRAAEEAWKKAVAYQRSLPGGGNPPERPDAVVDSPTG